MSLRKGRRQLIKNEKKFIKKHEKGFYKTLDMINKFVIKLIQEKETVTENNVQDLAKKYVGRKLDNMEKMIVLSKIEDYNYEETEA